MKRIKIKTDEELEFFDGVDYKDMEELLETLDRQLSEHRLQIVLADRGDDLYWVKIEQVGLSNSKGISLKSLI